jgi:hypothetical protein
MLEKLAPYLPFALLAWWASGVLVANGDLVMGVVSGLAGVALA